MKVARAREVAFTDDGRRVVILRLTALDQPPVVLVGSAAVLWRYLDEPTTIDELVRTIAADFDLAPEDLRPDVEGFVDEAERVGVADLVAQA